MADRTARIAGSSLGKGSGSGSSLTTSSITPVNGQLMLVAVLSQKSGGGNTPTLTGTNGLNVTWTAIATATQGDLKLTVFRGVPSSGTAGTLTIAYAAQSQDHIAWDATTYTNVNQTTNQGVVQSTTGTSAAATAVAITLGSAPATNANGIVYVAGSSANTTATAESGMTLVDSQADTHGTIGIEEMQQTATVRIKTAPAGVTFGASGAIGAMAIELTANNPLDLRPVVSDVDQTGALVGLRGVDMAVVSQIGAIRFKSVQIAGGGFAGLPTYGSTGPTGYPVGDPAGLGAVAHPGSVNDSGYWPFRFMRDDSIGNPSPPSQRQTNKSVLTGVNLFCHSGANVWTIDVLFEAGRSPYPRAIAKANPALGLYADVIATAVAPSSIDFGVQGYRRGGYAWRTLTLSFTLSAAGVIELWREKQWPGQDIVWWDNLVLVS